MGRKATRTTVDDRAAAERERSRRRRAKAQATIAEAVPPHSAPNRAFAESNGNAAPATASRRRSPRLAHAVEPPPTTQAPPTANHVPESLLDGLAALSIQHTATGAELSSLPPDEGHPLGDAAGDDRIMESIECHVADDHSISGNDDLGVYEGETEKDDGNDNDVIDVQSKTPDSLTVPGPDPASESGNAVAQAPRSRAETFADMLQNTDENEDNSPPPQLSSSPRSSNSIEAEDRSPAYSDWSGLSQHETADSILDQYLQATPNQETVGGRDFLQAQGKMYSQILKTFFSSECYCDRTPDRREPEHTHTVQERTEYFQRRMPPLDCILGGIQHAADLRASLARWQDFLSNQPAEPLSFAKTQAALPEAVVTITRKWDIDSIWLGAKDLGAIQDPSGFHLGFLPPHSCNISSDQVVQPHGLDLAHTRHIKLGNFTAGSVRFSVLLFFPEISSSPGRVTKASNNSLSLERQRDLYEEIILPAAYETLPAHTRQEIPCSYDLLYAKSRSFQEKPGGGARSPDDMHRAFHLTYHVPTAALSQLWAAIVQRANQFRVRAKRGDDIPYFKEPQLLFQSHDLKNMFARPSVHESMCLFRDAILANLDPTRLDVHSCWLDIGSREWVERPDPNPGVSRESTEAWTLLWKSQCHEQLHRELNSTLPDANAGHPDTRGLGIIRAKAYSCQKELFGVLYSSYELFQSGHLPLLAFDEGMLKELASMSQGRHRASTTQLRRESLLSAWEANKRHLRAISTARLLADYGARKEVTFRLDVILAMWSTGELGAGRSPHTGSRARSVPLRRDEVASQSHCAFWAVPTRDINALIVTQAARLVLPLEYLFQEAVAIPLVPHDDPGHHDLTNASSTASSAASSQVQQILAFYTAQLLCRLLTWSLGSNTDRPFDRWIWLQRWTTRPRSRRSGAVKMRKERLGLGLREPLDGDGMFWIPHRHMDWQRGHLSLEVLLDLYMPRSPLQARLAHQPNLQALTSSRVTIEYRLHVWLDEARRMFADGQIGEGQDLVRRAAELATEEIARSYHQHLLAKIAWYWDKARDSLGRKVIGRLKSLQSAQEACLLDQGTVVTAQTIWEIYRDAWAQYTDDIVKQGLAQQAVDTIVDIEEHLPEGLPCWMSTRRHKPPENSWCDFFLQFYGVYKSLFYSLGEDAELFDDFFGSQIGRYILVTFNSESSKEVGTRRGEHTWQHGKPAFFGIQFWAPYFSPPRTRQPTLAQIFPSGEYPRDLDDSTVARVPSVRAMQMLDVALRPEWVEVVILANNTRSAKEEEAMKVRCTAALEYMAYISGPRWVQRKDSFFMRPWAFDSFDGRYYGEADYFYLPIPETHNPNGKDKTIFLQQTEPPEREIEELSEESIAVDEITEEQEENEDEQEE
ncbi:hypothetical protein B0J13DRAFT_631513 [Dactylonectria estremocensis]|uniref:Uncharacterized protein n=1 Tax=Dactylonectria estremocensis TaxID=1079267 RepID=A0A9P9I910_9HYPO|nr:hypothetical protein B0J13DRAFT_631513 [Dactylonectria estremocensis]